MTKLHRSIKIKGQVFKAKMFEVARRNKYLTNCNMSFCQCKECTIYEEHLKIATPATENKIQKFTCCEHALHPRQCKLCQANSFESAVKSRLTKNVRGLISSIISAAPTEKFYCCRCETGFQVKVDEQWFGDHHYIGRTYAKKCDSQVFFVGGSVLIISDEFSKYCDDGFSITAGIIADPTTGVPLSIKRAEKIYNLKQKVLVCDHCIDSMLTSRELNAGGGINEQLRYA